MTWSGRKPGRASACTPSHAVHDSDRAGIASGALHFQGQRSALLIGRAHSRSLHRCPVPPSHAVAAHLPGPRTRHRLPLQRHRVCMHAFIRCVVFTPRMRRRGPQSDLLGNHIPQAYVIPPPERSHCGGISTPKAHTTAMAVLPACVCFNRRRGGVVQGSTTPELCARWISVGSFYTFTRSHSSRHAIPQELYRWPEVARAARNALSLRYQLLPQLYTAFSRAHACGGTVMRPIWWSGGAHASCSACMCAMHQPHATMNTPVWHSANAAASSAVSGAPGNAIAPYSQFHRLAQRQPRYCCCGPVACVQNTRRRCSGIWPALSSHRSCGRPRERVSEL